MAVRVVYDGVACAGKTTNLRQLCMLLAAQKSSALFSPGDLHGRTLFFDWMHVMAGVVCGFPLLCQVVSVPGQVVLTPRRRHLIGSADVVVYVCESNEASIAAARAGLAGAHVAKQGLFDAANGGTLFLDEIGDVDVQVQPKLLKVLEEKRFRRMGDVRERSVDVRLIGATHHDLLAAVAQKAFRADLYYRISTVCVTMPSLRQRREDVVALAYHMLADMTEADVELATDAKQVLLDYAWPGNLRELKNVLERSLLLRSGDVIRAQDLSFDSPSVRSIPAASLAPPSSARALHGGPESAPPPSRTMSEVERDHIYNALAAEKGRVEAAARRLGMPRSTLYQRIKDYGLVPSKLRIRVDAGETPPDSDDR